MQAPHLQPNTIALLSDVLISQIAAGEVIQRPASVVKELLENSIDAGADVIHILLKNGGIDEIVIQDNGHGIIKEQLKLAITRHATSKIICLEDLERIHTLGFRGEALASIASIAFLEVISKTFEQELAYQITPNPYQNQYDDDLEYNIQATQFSKLHGTEIHVKDIFFRTPARRKFLKTASAEALQCFEVVKRLAILHPHIEFKIEHAKQKLYFAQENAQSRALQILGRNEPLKNLNYHDEKYSISGFLTHPHQSKNRANEQHLIINKRWVRDKNLQFAIKQAYQQLTHGHGQNDYIVEINMPANELDVNVHPEKTEVRLVNAREMYRLLYHSVHQALSVHASHLSHSSSDFNQSNQLNQLNDLDALEKLAKYHEDAESNQSNKKNLVEEMHYISQNLHDLPNIKNIQNIQQKDLVFNQELTLERPKWPYRKGLEQLDETEEQLKLIQNQTKNQNQNQIQQHVEVLDLGVPITIIDNIYLVAKNKAGLILVDIHAAHERILYENYQIRYQKLAENKDTPNFSVIAQPQKLLLPLEIELSDSQYLICQQQHVFFKELGFEVEFCIQDKLCYLNVIAIPAIISNQQAPLVLYDLIEKIQESSGEEQRLMHLQSDFEHQWLARLACHAALRAHDSLNLSQMDALLRMIENTLRSEYCNHGRPTWRLLSRSFIDHLFKHGQ